MHVLGVLSLSNRNNLTLTQYIIFTLYTCTEMSPHMKAEITPYTVLFRNVTCSSNN